MSSQKYLQLQNILEKFNIKRIRKILFILKRKVINDNWPFNAWNVGISR